MAEPLVPERRPQQDATPASAGVVPSVERAPASVAGALLHTQRSAGNQAALLQAKLMVGRADDPSESEADAIADSALWRLAADGADDPNGDGDGEGEGASGPLARRAIGGADPLGGTAVDPDTHREIARARSGGQSLPAQVRRRMETGFGSDFAAVRVHNDQGADHLSRRLQAHAFTTGRDIFFSRGSYQPETPSGERLLAHELAHVTQQPSSAPSLGRTIRRYSKPTSDYKLASEKDAPAPFTLAESHVSTMPRTDKDAPGLGVGFAMSTPDKPPIFVAGDKTMALNSAEGEPKEFYATQEVIDAANETLERFKSPIMLVKAGNTITVKGSPGPLVMVRPIRRKGEPPGTDEFVALNVDVCRDVANWIIGSTAFNYAKVGKQRVSASSDQQTISGLHEVAETMTKDGSVDEAKTAQAKGKISNPTQVGKEYGTKQGKGELDEKAKELGVNQFAKAKVGEAYATQTIANSDDISAKLDHAFDNGKGKEHEFVWGYHFAAVVAESLNGKDQITLENYARKADENEARQILLDELKDKFSTDLTAFVDDTKGTDQQRIGQILHWLETKTKATDDEAKKAYNAMADEQLNKKKTFWYFRMVGEEKGQSFHEQMAPSGYFANPLTVAMGKNDAAGLTEVMFKEGSAAIPADRLQILKTLANNFGTDKKKGRTARLRVTGYSSGEAFGTKARKETKRQESAQDRIDAVVSKLVNDGVDRADIDTVIGDRPDTWTAKQSRRVQVEVVDGPGG